MNFFFLLEVQKFCSVRWDFLKMRMLQRKKWAEFFAQAEKSTNGEGTLLLNV